MANELLLASIANDPKLPTPPAIALRVLEAASRPECAIGDLTQIISFDPSLCGKILRTVNSAMYGLSRPVTTIKRALSTIGIKTTRSLVLSLCLPEMLRQRHIGEVARRYWGMSVAGAITARELSRYMKRPDPEDDLAAGLLRDLGMVVLEELLPQQYALVWNHTADDIARHVCELEEQHCGLNHAQVTAFLLSRWGFPREITEAVRHHHRPDRGAFTDAATAERAHLLFFSTRVAQLLMDVVPGFVCEELRATAQTHFGMDETQLRAFLEPLKPQIEEFGRLLNVDIGRCEEYLQVLSRAAEQLASLTVAANLDVQNIQEQKSRAEAEAHRWRQEAEFDPLTKVYNRRCLEERLSEFFTVQFPPTRGIGLLFIDLDGFKHFNDTYGHSFGDTILREVAETLSRHIRGGDMVARFGGDEFCILASNVDERGLPEMAQRIWRAANELRIRQGLTEVQVGVSIGVAFCQPRQTHATPEDLLVSADKAMYSAKANGKNRVTTAPVAIPGNWQLTLPAAV